MEDKSRKEFTNIKEISKDAINEDEYKIQLNKDKGNEEEKI